MGPAAEEEVAIAAEEGVAVAAGGVRGHRDNLEVQLFYNSINKMIVKKLTLISQFLLAIILQKLHHDI